MDKKRVLIIDDEHALQEALSEKFTRERFTILQAFDGKEGLKIALDNHPDIILLDIIMPVMDGVSMLKQLRNDPWGKTVPVIILSNLSDGLVDTEKTVADIANDYLIKTDWTLDQLVKKVREKLQ